MAQEFDAGGHVFESRQCYQFDSRPKLTKICRKRMFPLINISFRHKFRCFCHQSRFKAVKSSEEIQITINKPCLPMNSFELIDIHPLAKQIVELLGRWTLDYAMTESFSATPCKIQADNAKLLAIYQTYNLGIRFYSQFLLFLYASYFQ